MRQKCQYCIIVVHIALWFWRFQIWRYKYFKWNFRRRCLRWPLKWPIAIHNVMHINHGFAISFEAGILLEGLEVYTSSSQAVYYTNVTCCKPSYHQVSETSSQNYISNNYLCWRHPVYVIQCYNIITKALESHSTVKWLVYSLDLFNLWVVIPHWIGTVKCSCCHQEHTFLVWRAAYLLL